MSWFTLTLTLLKKISCSNQNNSDPDKSVALLKRNERNVVHILVNNKLKMYFTVFEKEDHSKQNSRAFAHSTLPTIFFFLESFLKTGSQEGRNFLEMFADF